MARSKLVALSALRVKLIISPWSGKTLTKRKSSTRVGGGKGFWTFPFRWGNAKVDPLSLSLSLALTKLIFITKISRPKVFPGFSFFFAPPPPTIVVGWLLQASSRPLGFGAQGRTKTSHGSWRVVKGECFMACYTYDISPKGAKASLSVCVSISGLRSPTNMW